MEPDSGRVPRAVSFSCAKSILDYNSSVIPELQRESGRAQACPANWKGEKYREHSGRYSSCYPRRECRPRGLARLRSVSGQPARSVGPTAGRPRAHLFGEHHRNRTIPCFIFQITVLISGLLLMERRTLGLGDLVSNAALRLKFAQLAVIGGLLSYVHMNLQPQIDALFAEVIAAEEERG
jgi:hypothetical protein